MQFLAQYAFLVPWYHLVPFAIDMGISSIDAAFLISAMGIANCLGRVVLGGAGDKVGHVIMLRVTVFAMFSATIFWIWAKGWWTLFLVASIFGGFSGSLTAAMPPVLAK